MKRDNLKYLILLQFTILFYFIITTTIYYLSVREGSQGISLKLFGGGDDGHFYWRQALNVANGEPWIRTSIYPLIIGNLIKVIGIENVFIVRIFNYIGFLLLIFFSIKLLTIQYTKEDMKINKRSNIRMRTLLLLMFTGYLSMLMNVNLSIYRDVWIYLFYVSSVYVSIKLMLTVKNRGFYLLLLLLNIYILGEFRKYAMFSFILTLAIYFLHKKIIKRPKVFIFYLGIFLIIYYSFFIDFTVIGLSLQSALTYRESSLTLYSGGSQMWIDLNQPNIILFLINYIHSYIGNLVGPLPWHITGMSTLLVFLLETIPMIFILNFLWEKREMINEIQKYILLHASVWIGLIGFTNDNIGTATRLRPVAWILTLTVFVNAYIKFKGEKIKDMN